MKILFSIIELGTILSLLFKVGKTASFLDLIKSYSNSKEKLLSEIKLFNTLDEKSTNIIQPVKSKNDNYV